MASRRALLPLAFLLLGTGCDTPDDDFPANDHAISIGAATFGEPVSVGIGQRTEEWETCHPRWGEFGPWIDCAESRERAVHLVSIDCDPAEACRDVSVDGAKGSFVPLRPRFDVKVVGDIEGTRVETTREVNVQLPDLGGSLTPEHAFAETELSFCRFEGAPEVDLTITLDGATLKPEAPDSTRPECIVIVPPAPGVLRVVPRLRDPEVDLVPVTSTIHGVGDAEDVEVHDQMCSKSGEVGAYADARTGKYFVSVSAMGMLRTSSTSRSSAGLPASRIRLVVAGRIVDRNSDAVGVATFELDEPPPAGSRVEVDLDGRIESVPLRAKHCD